MHKSADKTLTIFVVCLHLSSVQISQTSIPTFGKVLKLFLLIYDLRKVILND